MAKYSQELKERARDYYEIHSYNFDKISEITDVPKSTLNDWKRTKGWVKGRLKDQISAAKDKLQETITDNKVFQTVKDEILAEMKAMNPTMLATTVEQDVIIDNRAVAIMLEAAAIENLDALAMDGLMLANKKLKYLSGLPLKDVSMSEIKTYNDIVSNVKVQVHGKAPDTVIQVNQKNMSVEDYSKLTTEQLYQMLDKQKKESIDTSTMLK